MSRHRSRLAAVATVTSLALGTAPFPGVAQVRAVQFEAPATTWQAATPPTIPAKGFVVEEPTGDPQFAPRPVTWPTRHFVGAATLASVGSFGGLYGGAHTALRFADEYMDDEDTYAIIGAGVGSWLGATLGGAAVTKRPLRSAAGSVAGVALGVLAGWAARDNSFVVYSVVHGLTTAGVARWGA